MIEKSSGAACALALVLAGGSAQAEDLQLTPSSAWVVDYADDSCALRRTFGDPEQRVWLELRQFAPGDEFLVTTASATLGVVKSVPKSTFEPDGPSREQSLAAFGAYGEASEGISFPDSLRRTSTAPGLRAESGTRRIATRANARSAAFG